MNGPGDTRYSALVDAANEAAQHVGTEKTYLGDGVYFDLEGDMFVLTTENGCGTTNRIHLEPDVWAALTVHVARLMARGQTSKVSP